jgi:hypothetical protein
MVDKSESPGLKAPGAMDLEFSPDYRYLASVRGEIEHPRGDTIITGGPIYIFGVLSE